MVWSRLKNNTKQQLSAACLSVMACLSHAATPLPDDHAIYAQIESWQTLSQEQQLTLVDSALALKRALLLTETKTEDTEAYRQHYLSFQHSQYCSRYYLQGTPDGRAWLRRAHRLVAHDSYWEDTLRQFNRKSLAFERPLPNIQGCL